ncbi:DUF4435 domain-containing protein [Exiguobacterium sp. s138]|uniref:DUF4435 domain-containing protein n=1 Tax=Exiguobacterium sp. s138 TaxID=2751202 RepID=UPI001BEC49F0|nr:DUF4435 domain-containing protein [Exiguobacterium sp. s138]
MENRLSRDEYMRRKRDKGIVIFHKFVLKYKPKQRKPYCFVEGEDSKYYLPRVSIVCKSDPEFIRCDGKQGVLEAFREIQKHKEYENSSLLFFVDSDFDDSINSDLIYETPCYSIENLYTSATVFEKILSSEFNINDTEEDYRDALQIFINRQNEFHEAITALNAWIFSYKKHMERTGEIIKLHLKNLSLKSHLVDIDLDNVNGKYNLRDVESLLGVPNIIPEQDFNSNFENLKCCPHKAKIFRGKFELEFLKILLNKLIEDRNKKNDRKVFRNKGKISLTLNDNILTSLSIYAESPEDLYEYIEKQWKKSIALAI